MPLIEWTAILVRYPASLEIDLITTVPSAISGISISKSQVQFAKNFCAGLPVEIRNCDYRHIEGEFDRVSSIGMFEAVGHKNYRIFFDSVAKVLKNDGLFLLETIGCNKSTIYTEPWFQKNIFPRKITE